MKKVNAGALWLVCEIKSEIGDGRHLIGRETPSSKIKLAVLPLTVHNHFLGEMNQKATYVRYAFWTSAPIVMPAF